MKLLAIVIVCGLVGSSARARAEDIVAYQADGDADAGAANARVEALDEAFAKAVSQALSDLVDDDARRQHKPVLDRELLGHARLWVARFTVTKEAAADDRKRLSVSVRVDRDKLRTRLAELNIATRATPETPATGDAAAPTARTVTVLLRLVAPDGVHASYGLAAEPEVTGLSALSGALRRANLVVKRAPASGPSPVAEGELPVDDDTAEALGAAATAELVVIAGVTVGAPVPLRGIAASGVLVTATVRLVDRKAREAVGQGGVVAVARGTDPAIVGAAIDRALVAATVDALPPPAQGFAQPLAFTGDDTPASEPGIVLVRIARATPWGLVQSEIKHLLGARGVSKASLRHVSRSGWVIGVATAASIDRIASIVKKPPAPDTSSSVKIVGDIIEATLAPAP